MQSTIVSDSPGSRKGGLNAQVDVFSLLVGLIEMFGLIIFNCLLRDPFFRRSDFLAPIHTIQIRRTVQESSKTIFAADRDQVPGLLEKIKLQWHCSRLINRFFELFESA